MEASKTEEAAVQDRSQAQKAATKIKASSLKFRAKELQHFDLTALNDLQGARQKTTAFQAPKGRLAKQRVANAAASQLLKPIEQAKPGGDKPPANPGGLFDCKGIKMHGNHHDRPRIPCKQSKPDEGKLG